MSALYRAQTLLEREQYQTLSKMAEQEGRSISELVRQMVEKYLAEQHREADLQRETQALEALTRIRQQIEAQHGVLEGDFLAEARHEREQDIERLER